MVTNANNLSKLKQLEAQILQILKFGVNKYYEHL